MKIQNRYGSKLSSVALATTLVFTGVGQSFAAQLEEVIVTARKVSESLQDVPIAVTAFSASQLENAGVERPGDFIQLTSNVTLVEAQNAGTSFMSIRGMTQVRNGESPVATVVDGVLQVSPNQFTQELFDIQQVEILKGPQGALYGRNAIGGAIIISTKEPTNESEGSVSVGFGDGGREKLSGVVSGALVEDKLLYRLGVSYLNIDGHLDNVFTGEEVDFFEDTTVRGKLKWNVSDNLTADFRMNVSNTEGGGLNYVYQPVFGVLTNGANDTSIPHEANNRSYNERDLQDFTVKLDWDLGWALLSSITAYNTVEETNNGDQFPYTRNISATSPFGPNVLDGTQTQYLDVETVSQEFRLTSDASDKLRWMADLYFLETERFLSTSTGLDLGLGFDNVERIPNPGSATNPTLSFFADDNDNSAWAISSQVSYDVLDNLELSVALRYDEDEREQTNVSSLSATQGAKRTAKFDKLQPAVTLRYSPSDNSSLYASYAEGFRSGGFNQNGTGASAASIGLIGASDLFEQEESENIELGYKGVFADGRVKLNASIFKNDVKNQHYFSFVGAISAQILTNLDEVELDGFELEVQARLTDTLEVYAAYGETNSEIKVHSLIPTDAGNKAPYVPEDTYNIGAQWTPSVAGNLNGLLRVDYEIRGEQFWDPSNTTARDSLDLVNLRIGIESADEMWSLTAWSKNLTDEEYNSEWVLGGFAHRGQPRTAGIDFTYRF